MRLALKVDVDTDRGTRLGVPHLVTDCLEFRAAACFLFSLGPDNTGRAVRRVFRPGFFAKARRTSLVELYGVRTLLSGTLLPAPHIGRRNGHIMRAVGEQGFEVGIHCYDHHRWQDFLRTMSPAEAAAEFRAAQDEFRRIFDVDAQAAGAAGWQSTAASRAVYDDAGLLYASDTRGAAPFFPRIDGRVFRTLEIPTTMPTLDELMGRAGFPDAQLAGHLVSFLREDRVNVFTLHAEIEGMGRRRVFREFLGQCRTKGVEFVRLDAYARELLEQREAIPVCNQVDAAIDGRSGLVATQGAARG